MVSSKRISSKFQLVLVIFIIVAACALIGLLLKGNVLIPPFLPGTHGPLSLNNALNIEDLSPLYRLHPSHDRFAELDTTYYYHVNFAELSVFTYFTVEGPEGGPVRVAKMETFDNYFPYGLDVTTKQVSVNWASRGSGWTCKIPSDVNKHDHISGEPYQSCIYWGSGESYVLYSIWPESETVDFINALVRVGKD